MISGLCRTRRRLSRLDLATRAGTTRRYANDDAERGPDHDQVTAIGPPGTPQEAHTLFDTDTDAA